jgi:hypothetical protein
MTFTSKHLSVYLVTFDNTLCVNIRFILILIPIYVEQSNDTDSYIGLRVKKVIRNQFRMVLSF